MNIGAKVFYIESILAEPGIHCALLMVCVFQYGQHRAAVMSLIPRSLLVWTSPLQPLLTEHHHITETLCMSYSCNN